MRIRLLVALAATLAVGLTAAAADAARITGGTTTITPRTATANVLANNHITVTPLSPASSSGGSLVLPIKHGHFSGKNLNARVGHRGGVALSNGTITYKVRHPVIVANRHGAAIYAGVKRRRTGSDTSRRHWKVYRVARLVQIKREGKTATAKARLTHVSAHATNVLAGHHVVKRGAIFARVTVAPALAGKQ